MHNAEHRLIRGTPSLRDHAALPHFNASQTMQKFKSQTALVEIQANPRQNINL